MVMEVEVYCDENYPDILRSGIQSRVSYFTLGSLWIPSEMRSDLKAKILEIRSKHDVWGEIKWSKVSEKKISFYEDIIDLFFDTHYLSFRCVAVKSADVDWTLHHSGQEGAFYSFYYQLLHHWVDKKHFYRIFCDYRTSKLSERNKALLSRLNKANNVKSIQQLPSKEVVAIQLADFILGLTSSNINGTLNSGSAKQALSVKFENKLGKKIGLTYRSEKKYNLFIMKLENK